jgi:hypothetical protein
VSRKLLPALLLAACACWATAAAADAVEGWPDEDVTTWVGRWTLDRERSEPDDPLMAALDVPWAVRKIAAVFTLKFDVSAQGGAIEVTTRTPIGSRVDRFFGDGVERDGADLLGRPYRESSHWTPDGDLVVKRALQLDDGTADLEVVWSVREATLFSVTEVQVGSDPRVRIRRVFDKTDSSGI